MYTIRVILGIMALYSLTLCLAWAYTMFSEGNYPHMLGWILAAGLSLACVYGLISEGDNDNC